MKEYKREYPLFSLCGLNCCLCPQYHTDGESKCPGCGGENFHLKHPSCPVIKCAREHDNIECCYLCTAYPCERYKHISEKDSFITYRNVLKDFETAKEYGIEQYKKELNEKESILKYLLQNYNDGRRKSFYCLSVNLLGLNDIKEVIKAFEANAAFKNEGKKVQAARLVSFFEEKAKLKNIELKLRK